MDGGLFEQLLITLIAAVVAVVVFRRLRLPGIVAYLLIGMALGPYGLGVLSDPEDIRAFAELGIVFLLFTIGLEFSLAHMMAMRSTLLALGLGQVVLTTAAVTLLAWLLGMPLIAAFAVGAVLAQSSTTIISKQLAEQGEQQAKHGQVGIGISVFQDITAIPFVVIIPALAVGAGVQVAQPLAIALATAGLAFLILWAVGRWLLRPIFRHIAATRSQEIFTLTALAVALSAAWITELMGLSLALGAFLAGMMLAETEFRHQTEATIRPFRDLLLGLFFVSIGMLLDVTAAWSKAPIILLLALGSLALKAALVAGLARLKGIEPVTAIRTGLVLAVGGEFGFALLALALDGRLLNEEQVQLILGTVFVSMLIAPFLIRYNHKLGLLLARRQAAGPRPGSTAVAAEAELEEHVVICGFGRVGQTVARFLRKEQIAYTALDLDHDRVREAALAGEPVQCADATHPGVLEAAGIGRAKLVVVTLRETPETVRILRHVRGLAGDIPILVRAQDESSLDELQQAGATETVSETLEASLMLASHSLLLAGTPASKVFQHVRELRSDRYRLMRQLFAAGDLTPVSDDHLFAQRLNAVPLPEGAACLGKTLANLELESVGVTVQALRREGTRQDKPTALTRLRAGDVLILHGPPEALNAAKTKLLARL